MTAFDGTTSLQKALEQPSNQIDALTEWNGKKPTPTEFAKALGYQWQDIFDDVLFIAGIGDAPFKTLATAQKRRVIECFALEYPIYKQSIKRLTEKQAAKLIASNRAAIENLMKRHKKKVADNATAPTTKHPDVSLLNELNTTQSLNTIEPVANELNITQSDKFISINYRHADNSRHTVQLEQFYIDALVTIGITDISKFVADNAGLKSVTKNVKRSIVSELVKRVAPTVEPVTNELNITQLVSDVMPTVEPTQIDDFKSDGRCTISSGKNFAYRCKRNEYKDGRCKQHYDMFIKRGY